MVGDWRNFAQVINGAESLYIQVQARLGATYFVFQGWIFSFLLCATGHKSAVHSATFSGKVGAFMSGVFQLWRQGRLDLPLAVLQVQSFVGTLFIVVCSVLLYRYFSNDAVTPAWEYLGSVKLAVPPLAILSFGYFYAFLTGASVAEAPKTFWKWIRNVALQSRATMAIYCFACVLAGGVILIFVNRAPPPVYERLIGQLLGGSNDDNTVVIDQIKALKDKNPTLMLHLETIRQVFEERRKWNHENRAPAAALPRIFIRALDTNIGSDHDWMDHPLRWMASAEAHSMLAQALSLNAGNPATKGSIESSREIALKLYAKVATHAPSPLVTGLMRASARQNRGNVLYYSGRFREALDAYKELATTEKSTAVAANAVAAFVQLGEFKNAVEFGVAAMESYRSTGQVLNEIRDYISLVTNVGFARLILEQNQLALDNMEEVFDLLPDTIAKQNLALAHIANAYPDRAIAVLADDNGAPNVTASTEMDVLTHVEGGSCSYLIRAIALIAAKKKAGDISAHFAAYSRHAVSKGGLEADPGHWRNVARDSLAKETRPCGTLAYLPSVKKYLGS